MQRLKARTVKHAVFIAPQREYGVLLQFAQSLLQQIAVFELRIPQAGVGLGIVQCCLLRGVQDGIWQERTLLKYKIHQGVEGCGVVGHQRALSGVDKAVHRAGLW